MSTAKDALLALAEQNIAELLDENAKLRELLTYVVNEHLCATWLLEECKKLGIVPRIGQRFGMPMGKTESEIQQ